MKTFLKKFFSNLYEWFVASNRWLHLMAGWGIFIVMAFSIGIWSPEPNRASVIFGSYVATLIAMVVMEIKDKVKGGTWDWKDINAGMLLGNICLLFLIIFSIFSAS